MTWQRLEPQTSQFLGQHSTTELFCQIFSLVNFYNSPSTLILQLTLQPLTIFLQKPELLSDWLYSLCCREQILHWGHSLSIIRENKLLILLNHLCMLVSAFYTRYVVSVAALRKVFCFEKHLKS